jgi:hypothetical protein
MNIYLLHLLLKYLWETFRDLILNYIHEEIKGRLKSGNACCHSVQNLLSFRLLPIHVMNKIYATVIFYAVVYSCEIWSSFKAYGMSCTCSRHIRDKIFIQNFSRKTERRDHLRNLAVEGRIILKWILNESIVRMCSVFI